jgi:predicted lipid carrier protein YhbT
VDLARKGQYLPYQLERFLLSEVLKRRCKKLNTTDLRFLSGTFSSNNVDLIIFKKNILCVQIFHNVDNLDFSGFGK